MTDYTNLINAFIWFAALSAFFGLLLAIASKVFAVKVDERVEKITALLPGANCGGCGYAGCSNLAAAIVAGEAPTNACKACDAKAIEEISAIMGVEAKMNVKMRAQVMCVGNADAARKKYNYEGFEDCRAAARLGGGDKMCLNGCLGYGTCVAKCAFGAISIVKGVARVDYSRCSGCGACASACPKGIIRLIPYNSVYWVGCMSVNDGKMTRKCCDVGCISCKMCERVCEAGAITVNNFVASIDYSKCTNCGKCAEKCPRNIIRSGFDDIKKAPAAAE